MNYHNIIIFESDSLYNILFEIKENLSFKISNLINNKSKNENFNNYSLVITDYINSNYFLEQKKIDKNKLLFFSKEKDNNNSEIITLPIEIKNLIEKINIKLIKHNYNNQSHIKVSDYILDINSRIISKKNNFLKLTEKEIDIILFLNNQKVPKNVNILQNEVWGYSLELETHTVETHIYRLRKKISKKFNEDNFILSFEDGYLLK